MLGLHHLLDNYWAGPLLFVAFYCSDYYLTLVGARLYQQHAKQHMVFEGSFEITPYFQQDVDQLRRISPRFLAMLGLFSALLVLLRFLCERLGWQGAYAFTLGMLILAECGVHLRHFRNIVLFRSMAGGGVSGQLVYERHVMLRASAFEFLTLSGLYLLLFLLVGEWFFLGGVAGCLSLSQKHRALAAQSRRARAAAAPRGPS